MSLTLGVTHKCKTIGNNITIWLYYYQRCYFPLNRGDWFFILRFGHIFRPSKIKPQVMLF
nr:MAG TPA: hypothetical protein [Caudoviricetes sp.]